MTNIGRVGWASAGIAVLLALTAAKAQTQAPEQTQFEVATIKLNMDRTGGYFGPLPGGRLRAQNNPVVNLIVNAYGVRSYLISGGPDWIRSDRYDVKAKGLESASWSQTLMMLRTLLEDRFKLRAHRETKELPVLALTAGKNGIKLEPWREGSCVVVDAGVPTSNGGASEKRACGSNLVSRSGLRRVWHARMIDMAGMATVLSTVLERTVIDRTGFKERFDLDLVWTPDEASAQLPNAAEPGDQSKPAPLPDAPPSIYTVLLEQCGLKLESTKGPVEVLVIDHVERPSAN
jgi:uncharacterized protein (TIGR03435 family)